ncbi:transposase [Endozoicomonas sp.]|uniref:transposase n=1 Tax=Endozoicomonas sp. TaxID=1892382 RepID=UPI00383AF645
MTSPRRNLIDTTSTRYYHCVARCVRRAWLCGQDHLSGNNYEHRRQWVIDRLQLLVNIFAIEVCAYAIMSNHYHVVLHINATVTKQWCDREVLKRWTQLFNGPMLVQRYLAGEILDDAEQGRVDDYAQLYRERLQDISWFMRCLNEHLAREANQEDGCKGRFWEGRFKSQALLDEAAILTCMAYVDLNPIRVKMADTPEASDYTSIQQRITHLNNNLTDKQTDLQLKPLQCPGQNPDESIPFSRQYYFELVDWSGRILKAGKRGAIPADTPPILTRLGIDEEEWLKTIGWNNRFKRAVGKLAAMKAFAEKQRQQWFQGVLACRRLYSSAPL